MSIAVIVAKKPRLKSDIKMTGYKCKECACTFAVQSIMSEPFCPKCGGALTKHNASPKISEAAKVLLNTPEDQLFNAPCPCGGHTIMTSSTLKELLTKEGASVCCSACGTQLKISEEDCKSIACECDDIIEKEVPEEEKEIIEVPLVDVVDGDWDFNADDGKITAYRSGIPVAYSTTDLKPGLVDALKYQSAESDFSLGDSFNFPTVKIPVNKLVKAKLDDRLLKLDDQYEKDVDEELDMLGSRFKQSLAIILQGMPVGMFPECEDLYKVIRDKLLEYGCGPEVIEGVFNELINTGSAIAEQLHETASKLVAESDDKRNALAETASKLAPRKSNQLEDQLAHLVKPSSFKSKVTVENASDSTQKSQVIKLARNTTLFGNPTR